MTGVSTRTEREQTVISLYGILYNLVMYNDFMFYDSSNRLV